MVSHVNYIINLLSRPYCLKGKLLAISSTRFLISSGIDMCFI